MSIDDKIEEKEQELKEIAKGFNRRMTDKEQWEMYKAGIKLTIIQILGPIEKYCPTFYRYLGFSRLYKWV